MIFLVVVKCLCSCLLCSYPIVPNVDRRNVTVQMIVVPILIEPGNVWIGVKDWVCKDIIYTVMCEYSI